MRLDASTTDLWATCAVKKKKTKKKGSALFQESTGWCETNRTMRCRNLGQTGGVDMFVITSSSTFQKQTRLDMCQQMTPLVCQEKKKLGKSCMVSYSMTAYSPRGTRHAKIHSPEYVTADICALPKTRGKHKVHTLAKKTRDTGNLYKKPPTKRDCRCIAAFFT